MSLDVVTFGCRLNAYESEAMRREAAAAGLSDTVVVNTCAVTAEAVRQARQAIRRVKRERPTARIVVTGCAAQTEPATFAAMGEVDRVLCNGEKFSAAAWAATRNLFDGAFGVGTDVKVCVNHIIAVKDGVLHLIDGFEGRTVEPTDAGEEGSTAGLQRTVFCALSTTGPDPTQDELVRIRGAFLATTIAEHFRDQGKQVPAGRR